MNLDCGCVEHQRQREAASELAKAIKAKLRCCCIGDDDEGGHESYCELVVIGPLVGMEFEKKEERA